MKKLTLMSILAVAGLSVVGCARPGELGYTPAYSAKERGDMIARNWDLEGKYMQDSIDEDILMVRPASNLSIWNVRGGY